MKNRFEGVRVLVTGAADGIGRATAEAFLAEGAKVLAVDVAAEGLQYLNCPNVVVDVTAAEAPDTLASAALEQLGGLDVLFNNAGICPVSPLEDTGDEIWDRVLDVNLRSMFRISKAALPLLKQSEAGRIINTASVSARFANEGMGAYTVSKHGVAGLSKSLAAEWGKHGITVNYILPGAIVTGITRDLVEVDSDFRKFWEDKSPLGRWGQPRDIARAVLFLASSDAEFITGHGLAVDGGAMIVN
ncbi:MAG: NAD(P)-dependent dehydrogenase (short-subunit alcohol dehydrogenase family) [Halioglobus sp.]|jgi:NAD(P)-dependent dehydrogenase (short-subunit alcohol dehydrogenase family)